MDKITLSLIILKHHNPDSVHFDFKRNDMSNHNENEKSILSIPSKSYLDSSELKISGFFNHKILAKNIASTF